MAEKQRLERSSLSPSSGADGRVNKLKHLNPITGETEEPVLVSFEDVSAASYRIRKGVKKTPCERSSMSEALKMDLYFKKDYLQHTGSFKERGARNTLLMLSKVSNQNSYSSTVHVFNITQPFSLNKKYL